MRDHIVIAVPEYPGYEVVQCGDTRPEPRPAVLPTTDGYCCPLCQEAVSL
jgi:hypothetical protein